MKSLKSKRNQQRFVMFAGGVLVLTCLAKVASLFGSSEVLTLPDPLFGLQNRWVMLLAAATEAFVIGILISAVAAETKLVTLLWLSLNFSFYRICRWLIGANSPCACLGNLYDVIGLDSATIDGAMLGILVMLLAGSLYFCYKSGEFRLIRWKLSEFGNGTARIVRIRGNT